MGNGLYYLALGNASSDNSLKKSCCKITLILINKRASRLLRLKMLYTFVLSQGICVANHAADLPCFLKISSMCLPMFIRSVLYLVLLCCYRLQRYEINLNNQHFVVEMFSKLLLIYQYYAICRYFFRNFAIKFRNFYEENVCYISVFQYSTAHNCSNAGSSSFSF